MDFKATTQHLWHSYNHLLTQDADNPYSCDIFLNLKNPCDTLNHQVLLGKLRHCGIRSVVNDILQVI